MSTVKAYTDLERQMQEIIKQDFSPHFDELNSLFETELQWARLRQLGTELWVDSGSIEDIEGVWTREFCGLTVNNTLLNNEIQTGRYDALLPQIVEVLNNFRELSVHQKLFEISFFLNAYHGLRLVEKFDAHVSLEEHTGLANDVDQAVYYAKRLYNICPERFYIKIPFTAAGLLATRKLYYEGVPVNQTLGFSARQNYLIARISKPKYVNVFLGRLNSFIKNNDLGSGDYLGEMTTLASQKAITDLRSKQLTNTHQIGASFRNGQQVHSLAGIDVMTMPPKVANEFNEMEIGLDVIVDRTGWEYTPGIKQGVDPESLRLDSLWDIDQKLINCVDDLENENIDSFTPDDLINFFDDHNCSDILVNWSQEQIQTSYDEGKIPNLNNWKDALESKEIGLDSLLNLAGLNSFASAQYEIDQRVDSVLKTDIFGK